MINDNLTMLTDFYQLTMMNAYFLDGTYKNEAVFDLFFRYKEKLNYAVFAGLNQAIDYIKNLKFTDDDIEYLKNNGDFCKEFLDYLRNFKFTGNIYSVEEGEIVFPHEPILIVKAPLIEAQLIETALLNIICHQTLIASRASRIITAANQKKAVEFGLRRAQGADAAVYGTRASIIGGFSSTSNVLSGKMFNIPVKGTQSHSYVMSFNSELEAFENFAKIYPDNCLLLVDTYDTLKSGVPNAIKVFKKLRKEGHKPVGIRLDSGDLAYLSKVSRKMLDEAGFKDTIIFASSDLDEDIITSLNVQGAKIDVYGVGTKLITSEGVSSLGGVYKLSQININGIEYPKMKISSSIEKMTNPSFKRVYRIYDKDNMATADLITLNEETLSKPLIIRHETESWKKMELTEYTYRPLLVDIFIDGQCVYQKKDILTSQQKAIKEKARFWEEYLRLLNPEIFRVNISDKIKKIKSDILRSVGGLNE